MILNLVWIDFDPELRIQLKHMGIITTIGNNVYFIEYISESPLNTTIESSSLLSSLYAQLDSSTDNHIQGYV
jgi:hypothetical protein